MYTTLSSVFLISKHAQVSLFALPKFTKDKNVIYLLSVCLPYVLNLLLPLEMPKELTIPIGASGSHWTLWTIRHINSSPLVSYLSNYLSLV